ncbi:MAG: hypothetical protein ACHQ1H_14720, partial [Nitrososphaerales archaeon]
METTFEHPDPLAACEQAFTSLSRDLIGKKKIKKLSDFVGRLPKNLIFPRYTLECPLTGRENWGDIMFHIDLHKENPLRDISGLPKSWQACSGWNQLAQFAREFSDALGVHHEIWTEFDVGSSATAPYKPSIFLETLNLKSEKVIAAAKKCATFFGAESSIPVLQRCQSLLPEGVDIGVIAFMLSRPSNLVRVNLRGKEVNSKRIPKYLSAIGIADIPSSMMRALEQLEPLTSQIGLCLDIAGAQLKPKIGLEYYFGLLGVQQNEKLWNSCFDILEKECEIDVRKRTASLAWHGRDLQFIGNSPYAPHY